MIHTISSKPLPLTKTAIAYECEIYEQTGSYAAEIPWLKATASVQVNAYGSADCYIKGEKKRLSLEDEEDLKEKVLEHCKRRAKIVFETRKEQEP